MVTKPIICAPAPTVAVVDAEKFNQMVQQRLVYWGSLPCEISHIYPVEGVNPKWFRAAKEACARYRGGDRAQENLLAMAIGRTDWYLTCKELEGRVVYQREAHAAN